MHSSGTPRATPRLIAIDLDGTLLDDAGIMHARDAAAVRAASSAGVEISIVTGRLYPCARPYVRALSLTGPVACSDGSHLVQPGDDSTLLLDGLGRDAVRALVDVMSARDLAVFPMLGDAVVHDPRGDEVLGYVRGWSYDLRRTPDVFAHPALTTGDGLSVMLVLGDQGEIEQAHAGIVAALGETLQIDMYPVGRIPAAPYVLTPPTDQWAMRIRSGTADKGTALRWIAAQRGVALAETVAIGDWINDCAMLRAAGRSFAMPRAPDEVKACATDVLGADEGVAHALAVALGVALG